MHRWVIHAASVAWTDVLKKAGGIMKKDGYQLGIYEFSTKVEYQEAKKEQEAVELIMAKSDISDPQNALRLYNKMIARKLFRTHVGYDFLKELRKIITEGGLVAEDRLYPLPVVPQKTEVGRKEPAKDEKSLEEAKKEAQRYKILYEDLKSKKNSSVIIIIFLVVMLGAMVAITLLSDNTLITDYRSKIENEYSGWQEQLLQKERELDEREALLSGQGGNSETYTQ